MAKGQKRSNREPKKPKSAKKKAASAAPLAAGAPRKDRPAWPGKATRP